MSDKPQEGTISKKRYILPQSGLAEDILVAKHQALHDQRLAGEGGRLNNGACRFTEEIRTN